MARKGATADAANGKEGADTLIGPTSLMIRFTIPRAGLPVNTFVRAVWRRPHSLVRRDARRR